MSIHANDYRCIHRHQAPYKDRADSGLKRAIELMDMNKYPMDGAVIVD